LGKWERSWIVRWGFKRGFHFLEEAKSVGRVRLRFS
jgi:hypothetical protein